MNEAADRRPVLRDGGTWLRWIVGALLFAIAAFLIVGGGWLILLRGSPYYLVAGLLVLASAVWTVRRDPRGPRAYALMLVGTLLWALWEVGTNGWALVPRLIAPLVLGLLFLLPALNAKPGAVRWWWWWPGFVVAMLVAIPLGLGLHALAPADPADPQFQTGFGPLPTAFAPLAGADAAARQGEWLHYGRDEGGNRFSPLTQIDRGNVAKLKLAWEYHLGPAPADSAYLEVTPLKVGNALYICTAYNDVVSLDAETGHQNWRFRSHIIPAMHPRCRGVAYYRVPDMTGPCVERIIANTVDARLIALDAQTGARCQDFGWNGEVSLLNGMGHYGPGYYFVSSAPTIAEGRIILGGWVADDQYWGEPSGVIRAFDARTGAFAWAFDIGRPKAHEEPAPGQTYTPSTPNSWAPMSVDEKMGLVFAPTGNATPDFFGGQRRPFDDALSSSVVALDAKTGDLRWSFQTVHHDVWDYDVGSQPLLVDLPIGGRMRAALVQTTKRGEIFVLDRATGKPLFPVREVPVPTSGSVPGERLSPTQPFSPGMPSFRGPDLQERAMWGVTPLDQLYCRVRFRSMRYEGQFTPLSTASMIDYPGANGGSDWGSLAADPRRGLAIVNTTRVANVFRLLPRAEADRQGYSAASQSHAMNSKLWQGNTPYAAYADAFLSPLGVPCQQPPYGIIAAVDLTSGRIVWTRQLGTARDSGPFGIRSHLPITIGSPNLGGPLVTASGLVFIGATQERVLRALDLASGRQLWSTDLPAGAHATPMTYRSDTSGRQFVAVASSGDPMMMSGSSDVIRAYALPAQ